ncbi:unnamed protein product [Vicia faba]|uniref:Uncharacterized protein n=1 Tax=Vicia faba TaxID=3906 RepID=A0AAV1B234_VICFA|nr:unnamed protein product [Vicia faba]
MKIQNFQHLFGKPASIRRLLGLNYGKITRKVKKSKPKKRKIKQVKGLGKRVNFNPSYYACIAPRKERKKNSKSASGSARINDRRNSSLGVASDRNKESDNSLTDSEVLRCNNRLLNNSNSEVGKKLWDVISKLGVIIREDKSVSMKLVEAMEKSKISQFEVSLALYFWGNPEVEWTACNSRGVSGGMVILWNKNSLALNFSFIGLGFVGININWKGGVYNFVNVDAYCNATDRRVMYRGKIHVAQRKPGENE